MYEAPMQKGPSADDYLTGMYTYVYCITCLCIVCVYICINVIFVVNIMHIYYTGKAVLDSKDEDEELKKAISAHGGGTGSLLLTRVCTFLIP